MTVEQSPIRQPLATHPVTRVKAELACLLLVFVPHHDNSHTRKVATWILVATWAIITVLVSTGDANATATYGVLSAVVWSLIGRWWGIEADLQAFGGTITLNQQQDDSNDK